MTTATKTKQAPPPVDANSEHRQTRAGLHSRLKDRDAIKAALDEVTARLNEAHRAVDAFERPRGYLDAIEFEYSHKARAYNDLFNSTPQALANSCKDSGLRGQFSDSRSLKRDAIQAQQTARVASQDAVQALDNLRTKLTRGDSSWSHPFGEPAHLSEGDELPWATSTVGRLIGKVSSAFNGVNGTLWAIQGDVIEFRPGSVGADDIERDFVRSWAEQSRAVRQTAKALTAADERLKAASEALEVVRLKLIWSPK